MPRHPARPRTRAPHARRPQRAYTLVEMIIIITILGIASAIVIPSVGSAGTLRGQSSVRAVVSDIAFAQSDAMAFQSGRAVVFDVDNNSYVICSVNGASVDPETDALYDPSRSGGLMGLNLNDQRFGLAKLESVDIDGGNMLVFDEMGAPVAEPLSNSPSAGGVITIVCENQRYTIVVDGFTGHITTSRADIVGP